MYRQNSTRSASSGRIRSLAAFMLVLAIALGPGFAAAAWPVGGILVSDPSLVDRNYGQATPWHDATTTSFVLVWDDYGYDGQSTFGSIWAQQLTMSGALAGGWPGGGLLLAHSSAAVNFPQLALDGTGGGYVVWEDKRDFYNGSAIDIYGTRFTSAAQIAPGWPTNGGSVAIGGRYQDKPMAVSDALGGAYLVWRELDASASGDTSLAFGKRILGDGSLAGGWLPTGNQLLPFPGTHEAMAILPDGLGNMIVVFGSTPAPGLQGIDYATRLGPDASVVPGWPTDYVRISDVYPARRGPREFIEDGDGGFYQVWEDLRTWPGPPTLNIPFYDLYGMHWLANGTRDLRWPATGLPISTAPSAQFHMRLAPDGSGGLLVSWDDYRNYSGTTGPDPYALRLRSDGTRAPGWPVDGRPIAQRVAYDSAPMIAPDGLGGLYSAFLTDNKYVYTQHVLGDGSIDPAWDANGLPVCTSDGTQDFQRIAWDGFRGAIVTWVDRRSENVQANIYATHLGPDLPTAATLALVSAVAEPGVVRLAWQSTEVQRASLERRADQSSWAPLGTLIADGTGRMSYEDRDVLPGASYAYRLEYSAGADTRHTTEASVTVPAAYQLALAGFRPNPAVSRDVSVAFTLPRQSAGTLELLDVTGRRMVARDLGELPAGPHTVRLEEARSLAAGVYWLRLRHGGQALTARGVIVR